MRGWSDEAKGFVQDNAANMTVRQLVTGLLEQLNVVKAWDTVNMMCHQLAVSPMTGGKARWSSGDEQFVKDNYNSMTLDELADKLGRTAIAVQTKWYKMQHAMNQVTGWMDTILEIVGDGKSIYDLSVELYDSGRKVDVRTNSNGKFALFSN